MGYEIWRYVKLSLDMRGEYLVRLQVLNHHRTETLGCTICAHLFLRKRKFLDVSDAGCLTCELISMGSSAPYLGSTCPECGADVRWRWRLYKSQYQSVSVSVSVKYNTLAQPAQNVVQTWDGAEDRISFEISLCLCLSPCLRLCVSEI